MSSGTYQNPGQTLVAGGTISVAEIMGIANPAFTVNGQTYDFANAISKLTFKKLTQNSYDNLWNKAIKVQEMGNEGTVQYTFMPAVLPVSNFSQSDIGNRSFGTQMNVWGKNIMFLQTNFWTNEFTALTSKDYLDSIQKMLLGTYSKSISIMKNELSILENTLFCLATAQFYFTDELGRKLQTDPNDPNNLNLGEVNMIWSTQSPRLSIPNSIWGNAPQAFLKQELNALSTWLMLYPQSINTFNIGYSLDRLAVICSLYMRTNLAYALNMGWPTETNMNMVQNSSYVKPALSQWYNLILTDTNTVPYFQNDIGMVSQESMGSVSNNTYTGNPLGYGINNVCPLSYTRNIVAMTSFEGAIDQYYTNDVPFNPYNIGGAKTWYRLGYTWGWGQVHVPNYWGTSYMLLDPKAYCQVFYTNAQATANPDCDWTMSTSYNITVNGTSTSYTMAEPSNFPSNLSGFEMWSIQDNASTGVAFVQLTWGTNTTTNPMYISTVGGTPYCAGVDNMENPYFVYNKVAHGVQYTVVVGYNINQLLTDMYQAQTILNQWEPGMGYGRYCFPALPTVVNDTLSNYEANNNVNGGDQYEIGNSCGLTFAQWAGLRSLRALSTTVQVTNPNTTGNINVFNLIPNGTYQLLELVKIGYNQLYLQPYQYYFSMPNGAPYINNPGYSNNGMGN